MSVSLFDFVKSQVLVLDVVQEYVALKPAGNYWKGPSPFKDERVPSFTVTPSRGIYYCFSTATGGDVIDFVSRVENCSPLEAAWHLVERYNLTVPDGVGTRDDGARTQGLQRYEEVCSFFAAWCKAQLSQQPLALTYLESRGFGADIRNFFGLGYCPGGASAVRLFIRDAQGAGVLAHELEDANLLKKGMHGHYLTFEDRVVFTIFTAHGKPCGFGGRVFRSQDDRAKYVNSQEHDFFNKRTLLYGFWQAKKAIQETEAVYLVEGYTDCLAMVQGGYKNTVATLGTACSLEHLMQLSRHARRLYLLYDGDEAGQRAMMRLVSLCWQAHIDPYVLTFPPEDDPATFLAREGTLDALVEKPRTLFAFFVERLGAGFLSKSTSYKIQATQQVLEAIRGVPDVIQQNVLLQQVAETFGVPVDSLYQELRKKSQGARGVKNSGVSSQSQPRLLSQKKGQLTVLEKRILFAIIKHGLSVFSKEEALFSRVLSPEAQHFAQLLGSTGSIEKVLESSSEEERQIFLGMVAEGEIIGSIALSSLQDEIYQRAWNSYINEIKHDLAVAQAAGDQTRMVQALERLQEAKIRLLSRGNG